MKKVNLDIGKVVVCIMSDDAFIDEISSQYDCFVHDHLECDYTIGLHNQVFKDSDLIKVGKEGSVYSMDGGEFKAQINMMDHSAQAQLRFEISVFDSFLRVFYSTVLPYHNGFLVHSAGVAKGAKGYIFPGISGSGKTTTAQNAQDCLVLNDELTLIRLINNQFYLCATPFRGEYDGPIDHVNVPLQNICFLDKTLSQSHIEFRGYEVLVGLMENIFFFDSDEKTNRIVMDLSAKLTSEIEAFKVNIRLKNGIGDVIDGFKHQYSSAQ